MHRKYLCVTMLAAAIIVALTSFRCEPRGYVQADAANRDARRLGRPPKLLNLYDFPVRRFQGSPRFCARCRR
jgi:hypothetical protein